MLGKNFSRQHFYIFFFFFFSPENRIWHCMWMVSVWSSGILFSGKNKKSINCLASAAFNHSVLSVFGLETLHPNSSKTYTPQNNLRATSFIFPLIITKMRPSSFKIISWAKLEVSALFQSAHHVRNMFSYKSFNGTNNARPKDSTKNGNFQNNNFYPKLKFFHNTRKIPCLMITILCHTQNHANSTFLRVKDTQIWPEKEANHLRG